MTTGQPWPWPWPETMDALVAAPASHRVLMENSQVRVVDVVIEPGSREPGHTHQAVSVMIVGEPARIRYHENDALRSGSPQRPGFPAGVQVRWMEPEGPHCAGNIDERRYHAIRAGLRVPACLHQTAVAGRRAPGSMPDVNMRARPGRGR